MCSVVLSFDQRKHFQKSLNTLQPPLATSNPKPHRYRRESEEGTTAGASFSLADRHWIAFSSTKHIFACPSLRSPTIQRKLRSKGFCSVPFLDNLTLKRDCNELSPPVGESHFGKKKTSKIMRYTNWDVLLFPEGSKVPLQEFQTSCYVTEDPGTSFNVGR